MLQVMRAPHEEARQRAVRSLDVIGVAPKPSFDSITRWGWLPVWLAA